jgi:4-amino-4-deoxy-L-arabinose transferase-like glycosyltransferase
MLVAADGSLMAESLYVALITGAVLAAYRAIDRPTWERFATLGLVLGLATLTRSDGAFVVPLLVGCTAWRVRPAGAGRRLALGGVALGVAVAVLVPWTVRNAVQLHDTVPLSNNSGNLLVGANCPSTYGGVMLGTWDARCVPDHPAGTPEGARAAADRTTGLDYAHGHVGRLPLVVAARSLRVWGLWDPGRLTPLEVIESRNSTWQWWGWGYDLLVLVAAVPGAWLLVRRRTVVAPLIAVGLAVMATAATAYGSQRFALSAAPVLAVAAAVSLTTVARRRVTPGRGSRSPDGTRRTTASPPTTRTGTA